MAGQLALPLLPIQKTLLYRNSLLYSTRNLMSASSESKPAKTEIDVLITPNARNLRLAGWLIIVSVVVLVVSVAAFGGSAVRTAEFNQLSTVRDVAAYVSQDGASWAALGVGLWVGASLTFIGLILVALSLLTTNARIWAIVALVSLIGTIAFFTFSTYLLIGLAAGPDHLPPLVAMQTVSNERAVIGTIYEHISGLLATLGLMFVGIGLFVSRLLRRTGLVVAVLALILAVLGILFGAVPGPVVILSVPIAIGLLVPRRGVQAPAAATT